MPRAIDPMARTSVVLQSDRGREPAQEFVFKAMTGRQYFQVLEHSDRIEALRESKDRAASTEVLREVYDLVRGQLADWHLSCDGRAIPFDPARLEEVIGLDEIYELFFAMLETAMPEPDDAKNSESPPPTERAESASAEGPAPRAGGES